MSKPKILLIGTSGQVGWELLRCLQPLGTIYAAGRQTNPYTPYQIDLAHLDTLRQVIRELKPNLILNAAAYTAVDKAEEEIEQAQKINAIAPGILAEECLRLKIGLIHYSTDYVFDGDQTQPYTEQDYVNPMGIYGASKLEGERAIQTVGGQYLIFRTAWVYGLRGKNFLLTIQRLAQERDELKIVADQIGAPTWSRMIAETTVQVLAQILSPLYSVQFETIGGLYHLTCSGQTNWYDFAKAIIAREEKQPHVLPITTAEYPTLAKRPAYSVLSNAKLMNTFGLQLPAWDQALALCLDSK